MADGPRSPIVRRLDAYAESSEREVVDWLQGNAGPVIAAIIIVLVLGALIVPTFLAV